MNHRQIFQVATVLAAFFNMHAFASEPDMLGSSDFPDLPRVAGTRIVAYGQSEYDAGRFAAGFEKNDYVVAAPEGKRTRIVYAGQESQSSLQMLRNYQKAFSAFGEFNEVYACSGETCPNRMAHYFIWNAENMVPAVKRSVAKLHYYRTNYKNPKYLYGTIVKDGVKYHMSVFTSYEVAGASGIVNAPIVHLEVLEEEVFEDDLVFIDAAAMSTEIAERGSVALYGIQFEFDSAALQSNSSETIAEVAKALKADPELGIYVVGHTDGEGAHAYNQALSESRAKSVVEELVNSYGIAADRLAAIGVGQVAPVASNDTEEGRELNRRVAIVKR